MAVDRPDCRLTVYVPSGANGPTVASAIGYRPLPSARFIGRHVQWPARLRRLKPDAFFGPVGALPWRDVGGPSVITVHDLSFLMYPDRFPRAQRGYLRLFAALTARRAQGIMTDSEHTRKDVIRLLGADPERVSTVYPGLDPEFRPCEDESLLAEFRARHGLGEQPILFLGTLEPRKNVDTLVKAYAALRAQGLLEGQRLVLGGGRGWLYQAIFDTIRALRLDKEVVLPGYVPAEELPLWYSSAGIFVYPSAYEGFGLPPLEAMACGVPVITSNSSSLPEVVGDAAICVEPGNVAALAEAIGRAAVDPDLRREMRARGLERARRFNWEDTARGALRVYERVHERAAR